MNHFKRALFLHSFKIHIIYMFLFFKLRSLAESQVPGLIWYKHSVFRWFHLFLEASRDDYTHLFHKTNECYRATPSNLCLSVRFVVQLLHGGCCYKAANHTSHQLLCGLLPYLLTKVFISFLNWYYSDIWLFYSSHTTCTSKNN